MPDDDLRNETAAERHRRILALVARVPKPQDRPKCSKCGLPMVDPKSISIGVCLWCRPWP